MRGLTGTERAAAELARLAGATGEDRARRAASLRRLAAAIAASARGAGASAVLGGRWLVDVLLDTAPRIPVRDLPTLRAQHGGLDGDDLADALIAAAARASAGLGAAAGSLAAVQWSTAPPLLLSAPAQLAAETLAVAALETKLIAELHQVYGVLPPGPPRQRALAYVWAWTNRRGVDPLDPSGAMAIVTGPARRAVRNRLAGRVARTVPTLGPLLTGAVVGSAANHRETTRIGRAVRNDLRRR